MKEISTIFCDIGGVCLSNGWDHISREKACKEFSLDYEEMERRHKPVFKQFEKGKFTLDEYLNSVIFYKERKFTKKDFIDFMYSQSLPFNSSLNIIQKLSTNSKYLLATINNESRELNNYRISRFGLDKYFRSFFSSCYLGIRKPESEIFHLALNVLHKNPENCLFIDDREENYHSSRTTGMHSILLDEPENLQERLEEYGVEI